MRKLTCFILLAFSISFAKAQNASVSGIVVDTLNHENLKNAVVTLLRAKDSTMVKFSRSKADGSFIIQNIPVGNYILMITYPSYATQMDEVKLDAATEKQLGKLAVIKQAALLQEVLVKQKIAAIRIKGDTTEYRADSFKVGPNANVQDLLKKLPGLTVNSKGEITAQGEKVTKILVDGEEFFSDDPAIVTKNLRSDAVSVVQVYDKKSDQAEFTGIDDGQKIKTINLELKEDAKKGYFGKIEAGTDFDKYRIGRAMINAFRGKKKLAAFVTSDNTQFQSLNWDERSQFGEDLNRTTVVGDDGGTSVWSNGDEFSYGEGLPTSVTGGLLFSNKWKKDKNTLNAVYQFNQLNVTGNKRGFSQSILADTSISNTIKFNQFFDNDAHRSRGQVAVELELDSTSSLKTTFKGTYTRNKTYNTYESEAINDNKRLLNNIDKVNRNDVDTKDFNLNLFYKKKFAKKGRTISLNVDFNQKQKKSEGILLSNLNLFNLNGPTVVQNLDQQKANDERLFGTNAKVTYTEPLWKDWFLEMNYRFSLNRNDAERNTLEKLPGTPKYDQRIDTLSNHFLFNNNNNQGGAAVRYNGKKITASLGADIGRVNYNMDDLRRNTSRSVSFNNFLPRASFKYAPKKQTRFEISYTGSTENPTINQIQPIIDNIDPLNITIGNPNLQQAYKHRINFNFSQYKVLKSQSIYVGGGITFTDNAISNANVIDANGKNINQTINVDGNFNGYMWSSYGFEIAPSVNLSFGLSPNVNRYVNVVNGKRNVNDNFSLGFNIQAGYWGDKWYNFWCNFEPRYNIAKNSLSPLENKFWTFSSYPNFDLKFKKLKLYVNFESEIQLYSSNNVFAQANNQIFLKGSIKKTFLKSEELELKLTVNDILNRNNGIDRSVSSNFINETISTVLQRFAMISVTWNFTKSSVKAEKN